MLQEICRISLPVTKYEELNIKWHNSFLTLRSEKGIQIHEFSYNLQCYDKNIDFKLRLIPNPKSSAVKELIPYDFWKKNSSNLEITETLVDPSLWPVNSNLVKEMANVADFQWSPSGMIQNNECVLAVLSNIGNVELYCWGKLNWEKILNISELIKRHYKSTDSLKIPRTFTQLKAGAHMIESSAICWGPKATNNVSLFATAQKNKKILFWRLKNDIFKIKAEILGEIHTNMEIFTMIWISKSNNELLLICSSILGEVIALDCVLQENEVKLVNSSLLWPFKDKMVTKYIHQYHTVINDNIILIYNKYRHLVVQMIDKNSQVVTQFVQNINDYKITDISTSKNVIYLTTINCKIYKIDINVNENNLNVNLTPIETKDIHPPYELYGIAFSSSKIIWALAAINRKVICRKKQRMIDIVFFKDPERCAVTSLVTNANRSLTDHWDCIELLRYRTMKYKELPSIDYNQLYEEGDTDLYKLKVYLIFLILYQQLIKLITKNCENILPETSVEIVKDKILALHASQVLEELFDVYRKSGKMLKGIQLDSYLGAKIYLEYYCKKYDKNITRFATSKTLSLSKKEREVTCQSCEDKIQGFSCKNGHLNMCCCLTFTPIDSNEYLFCKSCNSTARKELYENNPRCIFCDLYMKYA